MNFQNRFIYSILSTIIISVTAFADNFNSAATGAALEQTPSGIQAYGFWNQILANQVYYEVRAYAKYNYITQNPLFNTVPVSNENNVVGYGFAGKLGYNFVVNNNLDILPYFRINAFRDMSVVYADTNGDYIHSDTLAELLGVKFSFTVSPQVTPYFDFYGGYQQVYLTGSFTAGQPTYPSITATVAQWTSTMEFGSAFKVSPHISIIPYIQFVTTANYPDSTAGASYANGGFNISQFTSSYNVFALKLSANW